MNERGKTEDGNQEKKTTRKGEEEREIREQAN